MQSAPFVITTSLALMGLAGCVTAASQPADAVLGAPETAVYRGVQTRLLEDDLVHFIVTMQGARDAQDPIAYSRCAAAQYALIRGFGFARHVRTNVTEQGGLWRADAVYTVSPALPRGFHTIDAEVTVADCTEQGIPTV
ncbi:hypothetical protein [Pararhodobacter sp.]|uniref:hypothetical protein n=1 Tax=Pararhodobacter sp. TaxID=2127056 RepID=UPI002AFE728B|nr:hypothetical protein [Pararhodobacter sp.]